jgi:hypothetical protein
VSEPAAATRASTVLERGGIYFLFRPKVEVPVPHDFDDVQRLYLVLHPLDRATYRLIIVWEKRLPATTREGDRRSWAFVDKVASRPEEIEDELDPQPYETRTRGPRLEPPARPAGEGVYAIVRHEDHTHLAFALELPEEPGEVQRALDIPRQGSYIVSVRNPESPAPPGVGLDPRRRATYPEDLQQRVRGRRFIPLDPPDFLDHVGAELLLIGATQDVTGELGIRLDPERETDTTADIFEDLRLERSEHPIAPLLTGRWE